MCTSVPPLEPQHQVPAPVPSLETCLKGEKVKGRPMGADTIHRTVKKKHKWNPMASKDEWWKNTEILKAKGKAMDTYTGNSSGYQSQPNSLVGTHLVRKWGDIGRQRALSPWSDGWKDGIQPIASHIWVFIKVLIDWIIVVDWKFSWSNNHLI